MLDGLFVTGTDTEVGKTVAACALARWLRREGHSVAAMKPVASGCRVASDGVLVSEDAERLLDAAGCDEPLERVNPVALEAPLAPTVAARLEAARQTHGPHIRLEQLRVLDEAAVCQVLGDGARGLAGLDHELARLIIGAGRLVEPGFAGCQVGAEHHVGATRG